MFAPEPDALAVPMADFRGVAEGAPLGDAFGEAEAECDVEAAPDKDGLEDPLLLPRALADTSDVVHVAVGVAQKEKKAVPEGDPEAVKNDVLVADAQCDGKKVSEASATVRDGEKEAVGDTESLAEGDPLALAPAVCKLLTVMLPHPLAVVLREEEAHAEGD